MDEETLPLLGEQDVVKEPGKLKKLWKRVQTSVSSQKHKLLDQVTILKTRWRASTEYSELDKEDRKKYESDQTKKRLEEQGFL